MTVSEIMTSELITAGMDDTLGKIRKVFELHRFNHIPIIEEDKLVGIVFDRDVLRGLSPNVDSVIADNRALNTLKKKAHQVMTREVHTISPDATIEDSVTIFLEKQCSCLPVLEPSGQVVGILTKTDLLKCLRHQMQLLTAVS